MLISLRLKQEKARNIVVGRDQSLETMKQDQREDGDPLQSRKDLINGHMNEKHRHSNLDTVL